LLLQPSEVENAPQTARNRYGYWARIERLRRIGFPTYPKVATPLLNGCSVQAAGKIVSLFLKYLAFELMVKAN
jgi:hypothetical protein